MTIVTRSVSNKRKTNLIADIRAAICSANNITPHSNTPAILQTSPPSRISSRYNLRPRKIVTYFEEDFIYHDESRDGDYTPYVHNSHNTIGNAFTASTNTLRSRNGISAFICEVNTSHLADNGIDRVFTEETVAPRWFLRSSFR